MALKDINGNVITNLTSGEIRTALVNAVADGAINIGSTIGATLSTSFGDSYAQTAYSNMLEEYKKAPNSTIPFFISTDQHGRGLQQHRWVNNIDTDGVNMANINLGDTVMDSFSPVDMKNFYGEIWQVKNYIGVPGNHEFKSSTYTISDFDISRAFCTTNYLRTLNPSTTNCYTVIDGLHNVKYVIIDEYATNENKTSYTAGLTAKTAEWLIHELSADDGFDIVILKHWGLAASVETQYRDRNGTVLSLLLGDLAPELSAMLAARKNKISGTFTDVAGGSHSFDFTNCKTNLLCCLHGHTHNELYGYLNGLLCYCADWYGNNHSCVFGLIDRVNNKLKIFKFDSTQVYDMLEIDM